MWPVKEIESRRSRYRTSKTHGRLNDLSELATTRLYDCLHVLQGLFSLGLHAALDLGGASEPRS